MSGLPFQNPTLRAHTFLRDMVSDPYYPPALVAELRDVLHALCVQIEATSDLDLDGLYVLTHAATEQINGLQERFEDAGSEIETMARESIGEDFWVIAQAYGFDGDSEELIAPRDW